MSSVRQAPRSAVPIGLTTVRLHVRPIQPMGHQRWSVSAPRGLHACCRLTQSQQDRSQTKLLSEVRCLRTLNTSTHRSGSRPAAAAVLPARGARYRVQAQVPSRPVWQRNGAGRTGLEGIPRRGYGLRRCDAGRLAQDSRHLADFCR